MSDNHAADIDRHVKQYMFVFGALMVLTFITVGIASLDLSVGASIALALFVALIKGSLVAGYFMHLISEKKMIYWVLFLTAVFFVALLMLPVLTSISDKGGP